MKLTNITQVKDFLAAVDQCKRSVWLESSDGSKFDLKSEFSKYIAIGELLGECGDQLELFCADPADEQHFYDFFAHHAEAV